MGIRPYINVGDAKELRYGLEGKIGRSKKHH